MRILFWLALLSPLAPGSSPMEQPTPCRQLVHPQVLNCTMKPGSWAGQDFAVQLDHHGPWPKIPLALGSSANFLPVQVQSSSLLHDISQVLQMYYVQLDPLKFGWNADQWKAQSHIGMSTAKNGILLQTLSIVLLQPKKQKMHENACELKYQILQSLLLLKFTNCHQLLPSHSLPSIHKHIMFTPGTDCLVRIFRKEVSSKEAGNFIHVIFYFLSLFQFIFMI